MLRDCASARRHGSEFRPADRRLHATTALLWGWRGIADAGYEDCVTAGRRGVAPGACFAQSGAAAPEERAPALAPLGVGQLHIASDADLDVEKIAVDVTLDSVVATYVLRNKGRAALDLAASVALPGLQAFAEDGQPWNLPAATPENPVSLSITAGDAPVATKADVKAFALGVDRRPEIEAARLPLLPFGPRTAQALAALSPKARGELSALGVVSPRDPDAPGPRHPRRLDARRGL